MAKNAAINISLETAAAYEGLWVLIHSNFFLGLDVLSSLVSQIQNLLLPLCKIIFSTIEAQGALFNTQLVASLEALSKVSTQAVMLLQNSSKLYMGAGVIAAEVLLATLLIYLAYKVATSQAACNAAKSCGDSMKQGVVRFSSFFGQEEDLELIPVDSLGISLALSS
jgi:hypothetical protein